jgi:hypothetical protein
MQVERLEKSIATTLATLAGTGVVLKGSISKVTLGKKTRTRGDRVSYLLTYKGEGNVTKSLYIRKDQVTEVKQMIRNHHKLKAAVNRLLELNVRLFKARQMTAKISAPSPAPLR